MSVVDVVAGGRASASVMSGLVFHRSLAAEGDDEPEVGPEAGPLTAAAASGKRSTRISASGNAPFDVLARMADQITSTTSEHPAAVLTQGRIDSDHTVERCATARTDSFRTAEAADDVGPMADSDCVRARRVAA